MGRHEGGYELEGWHLPALSPRAPQPSGQEDMSLQGQKSSDRQAWTPRLSETPSPSTFGPWCSPWCPVLSRSPPGVALML